MGVKTLEEHRQYVEDMCRLSYYYVRKWLVPAFPEKSAGELLRQHTPLFYHALGYMPDTWETEPACQWIQKEAEQLVGYEAEDFEEVLWEITASLARKRADEGYVKAVGVAAPASWNCGSLKYDAPNPNRPEGWISFHIANAVGPNSIFSDPEYLAYCFMLLMKEAEIRYGARVLSTTTWLNGREEFLKYFPDEWRENLSEADQKRVPSWHFGYWGQLVNARGMINKGAEVFVRENGYLKYPYRSSHCSFEKMRSHLKEVYL